jgi:quercetin dioxygenase-like cupin family protein
MSELKDIKQNMPEIKPILENDRVRLLDFKLQAGKKTAQHSHPDTVYYASNDQKLRFIYPDEEKKVVELKLGQAIWINAETHVVENIGKTEARGVVIELKK